MSKHPHTPLLLTIFDGWGYREATQHNAIAAARTPVWDQLWQQSTHLLLSGSGEDVGLPLGQMGNSEVGHLTIGAGRVLYQDLTRIDKAIADNSFFKNPILVQALKNAAAAKHKVHVLGLLSPGGVHSHEQHIFALFKMAKQYGVTQLCFHAILDGRDTPPKSALKSLQAAENLLAELQCGKIVSIIGRYYAMDRDKRFDRTQLAYQLLTEGKADFHYENAITALEAAYARGETDEFVKPTLIMSAHESPQIIGDDDTVIFMNFRADRARQLTRAFTEKQFTGFIRSKIPDLAAFITLTEYAKEIPAQIVFPPQQPKNSLPEILEKHHFTQLRIAETEKYAHVTYFFSGGREQPFTGEERILIPSPKVATYDLQPEMSALELTDALTKAIHSQQFDFIICNYANPDMVGHTGNFNATVKAIETIDQCLQKILAALKSVNGELIITADHGNAEQMYDDAHHQPHTAHTNELVPFVYWGRQAHAKKSLGSLSDIAPTILYLLDLKKPQEMSGETLIELL